MTGVTAVQAARTGGSGDSGERGYIVKGGDTLSHIAQRHGVSLESVIRANPQISNPDLIRPGQHVSIPAGGESAQSYTVRQGDTLSAIGERFGVPWRDIARENGIANPHLIHPGRELSIPGGGGRPGGGGEVGGTTPVDGPTPSGGGSGDVARIAEKYLGQNASSLKTNTGDSLPMNPNVPSNLCCANFVSAVLTEAGKLPANLHTDSVAQLDQTLRGRGWTPVPASEAKPGDVVIIQGGGVSHTEIIAGPGKMIGSNNVNADGSQKVSYDNLSWALEKGAVILRAPGGGDAPSRPDGPGDVVPTGQGGREARIDQAVNYFESQGWSRAQAIGIVANLDMESGMDPGIKQIGGGPGYGLAQWEGPRQESFRQWAGHEIQGSSFAEQLRFVQWELTNTEAAAGNRLRQATDPGAAAEIVCRYYERPADIVGDSAERAQRAAEIAARY